MSNIAHILLFGTTGQLGGRLMESLSAAGYEVTGIDRARCDFTTATPKDIAVMIRAVEPKLIINAVAYTAVDKAENEPELGQRINGEMPAIIAAAAQEQQVPLLHFSTDYVFDGAGGAPYNEAAPTRPLNVYATSKLSGEAAVLAHGGHVFRLQWVFDARGKNFFLTMKKLLAERDALNVVADQVGAPSNAAHLASAVTKAAPLIINQSLPAGIYHLAALGHTSWHGFACAIAAASGSSAQVVPITSAEYPLPAARPKDVRLNTDKLARHGITMPHWRDGLTRAMEDERAYS